MAKYGRSQGGYHRGVPSHIAEKRSGDESDGIGGLEFTSWMKYHRTKKCPRRGEDGCRECRILYSYVFRYCKECGRESKKLPEEEKCLFAVGFDHLPKLKRDLTQGGMSCH